MTSSSSVMQSVADLVEKFGKASAVIPTEDYSSMVRLCEVVKDFMHGGLRGFVQDAAGLPVLRSFCSDGTPIRTWQRWRHVSATIGNVYRQGGSSLEFLVQRAFFMFPAAKGYKMYTVMDEPLPLHNGKKAWQLFLAGKSFVPSLLGLGHQGISLNHYCFDRGVFYPLRKFFYQFDAIQLLPEYSEMSDEDRDLSKMMQWFLATPCCLHDVHNAQKRAMAMKVREQLVKDLFIVIASIRNGYDLVVARLYTWLMEKVSFQTRKGSYDDHFQFWTMMDIPYKWAEKMAELGLCFKDGRLCVDKTCENHTDIFGTIFGCLLHVFKFRKFSDSRWLTIGDSCKTLACSLHLGIDNLIGDILRDSEISQTYIGGFSRLDKEMRSFVVLCASSCNVCQTLLASLLEDDRVGKRLSQLEECIQDELNYTMCMVSPYAWQQLAEVISSESCPVVLRSEAAIASLTAAGFVEHRFISIAKELPWSLVTQGDNLNANLDSLLQMTSVTEETSLKILKLLKAKPRSELITALELMKEIRWGSLTVEQGHASAAVVSRYHQTLGRDSLLLRSFFHMCKALFKQPIDPKTNKQRAQIARLEAKMPSKSGAFQQCYKEVMAEVKAEHPEKLTPDQITKVMESAHELYAILDQDEKDGLATRAMCSQVAKENSIADDIGHLEASIMLRKSRASQEALETASLLLTSNCTYNSEQIQTIQDLFDAFHPSEQEQKNLRLKADAPPQEFEEEFASAPEDMGNIDIPQFPDDKSSCNHKWLQLICWGRDQMGRCALKFCPTPTASYWFLFLYGTQSPLQASLLPLHPVKRSVPDVCTMADFWAYESDYWRVQLEMDSYETCRAEDIEELFDDCEVHVLPGLTLLPCGRVWGSNSETIPLWEYIDESVINPKKTQNDKVKRQYKGKRGEALKAFLQKYPYFMMHIDAKSQRKMKRSKKHHKSSKHQIIHKTKSHTKPPIDPPASVASSSSTQPFHPPKPVIKKKHKPEQTLADAGLDNVWEKLGKKRAEWSAELKFGNQHFRINLNGGKFAREELKKDFDAFKGICRSDAAVDWCKDRGIQSSFHNDMIKYGEQNACHLATAWVDKMEYFRDLYDESGRMIHSLADTQKLAAAYEEPSWITEWGNTLDQKSLSWKRLQQCRAIAILRF